MTEQWKELKETIIEMRDNDGTETQQEVCKFLANLMDVLEKQMQESCENAVSRQAVIETLDDMDHVLDEDRTIENYKELLKKCYAVLPPVNVQPKVGHWIYDEEYSDWYYTNYKCSCCKRVITVLYEARNEVYKEYPYCHCGAKMHLPIEEMPGDEWVDDVVESMKGETSHTIIPQEEMDALLSGLGDMYEPYKESEE